MDITIPIFYILFLLSFVFFIISGILYYNYRADINKPKNKAKNILYERYAKGEITKEEFEDMKKDLED